MRSCHIFALGSVLILTSTACGGDDDGLSPGADAAAADDGGVDPSDTGPDAGAADAADPADAGSGDAGVSTVGIEIPELEDRVTARFDPQRVLHVECSTPEDCIAVQGYFHAAHRFGQMDFSRRAAQGRLTELYWSIGAGSETIGQDVQARTVFADREGRPLWEALVEAASPRTLGYLQAYTRGVNAWLGDFRAGENGAELSRDWVAFANRLEPWTVEDTVSTVLLLVNGLTNRASSEIAYAQAATALSPAEVVDLLTLVPATDAVISPDFTPGRARDADRGLRPTGRDRSRLIEQVSAYRDWLRGAESQLQAVLAKLGPPEPHGGAIGSNNWVLRASQSRDGSTLLANDPHLSLSNPSIWYLVNLDATAGGGSFHIAGVSYPGFPGILLGQNGDIAWGATTTVLDQSDVYLEELVFDGETPVGVRFEGQTVPFVVDPETFANPADGSDMMMELLYVPHHGPVIDLDPSSGRATTLRWTAQDISTDIEVFPDLWEAADVDAARTAIEGSTTLGQNFVVVDDQDNIGWFPYNQVPSRPWASPETPPWGILDGTSGNFEWGEPIPLAQLPQAQNPSRGWIVTANNDMNGNLLDGDPTNDAAPYLQAAAATGYRAARASDLVALGSGQHDLASMRSIQADAHSLVGERTLPAILSILAPAVGDLDVTGETVRQALIDWDHGCPTGLDGLDPQSAPPVEDAEELAASKGCLAFHVLWTRLHVAVFGDELRRAGYPRSNARDEALARYLVAPETFAGGPYWDEVSTPDLVETSSAVMAEVFDETGAALIQYLGGDESRWQWGRLHTVTLRTNDGRPFNEGPYANDGGAWTVDVANPSFAHFRASRGGDGFTSNFSHTAGPSMRLACAVRASAPDEPPECQIDLPGRQRFFSDPAPVEDLMVNHWLPNEAFPLRFAREAVTGAAVETVEFRPESEGF